MTSFVDNEFALRYFSYQRNFKQVSTMPYKLNCSCPICGDSTTDSYKARFWYYIWKDSALVHCFNCDYSSGWSNFLREQDEVLFREYLMEKRKEETFGRKETFVEKVEISDKLNSKLVIEKLDFCKRLDRLPENHPIIKYVENRAIPKSVYHRLWFTSQWQELVNKTKENTFENPKTECRLVIPIYNKDKKIEAYQGRALSSNAKQKYMTIKAHEDASKVYGVDCVDDSLPWVYVFEGPIDSLFIPNGIAITGGSLDLNVVPYPDKRIWVMDNEPRHPDTIKRMNKLIESGEKVLFWDSAPWTSKDINDMISKEHADPDEIKNYIDENWECGMMAKLRMNKFCKI